MSRQYSIKRAARAYIGEIWHQRKWSIAALLLPGLASIFTRYIPPLIIAAMIKNFDGRIPSDWYAIAPYLGLIVGSWLIGEAVWRIAFLFLNRTGADGMRSLYATALQELLKKDAAFFNDNFAGSLTKKVIGYGKNFESFIDTLSFNVFGSIVPLGFALVVLWTISPLLVGVMLALIVVTAIIVLPFIRKRQRMVLDREAASNQMAGHVADVIGNISAVQAFAREDSEQKRHQLFVDHYMKTARRTWDYHVLHIDMIVAPSWIITNAVGLIVAIMFTDNAASFAAVFLTFSYFMTATEILFEFNRIYRNLETALSEAAQYTALLEESPRIQEHADAKLLKAIRGDIVFKNVDFAYDEQTDGLLFDKLNLHIKPGEKIALVGHSGGGKTTVTKLLLRFVDISGGELLIDGQNIADVTFSSLRNAITSVPQDPAMFHRSLKDNIRYGNPTASDEAVREAARQANALEFIEQLPEGFETLVGERGVKLSGGQRQRIAIARAMLKNAPILVLDEATSALDSESEVLIQQALWKLMEGHTAIVIAHRLSTIQKMDRIIVLDNGRIVEQGSHKELVGKPGGTYAKLWAHQSGGFIDE
ncbi:ABC transporter ATP-binding protein [Candidatus Saccharibacteria bacterium]|nr:MAG: ABC transporter ATP-binding protein [Candidatus Saccharibacteria bacterium]